jgi:hypothetical protein
VVESTFTNYDPSKKYGTGTTSLRVEVRETSGGYRILVFCDCIFLNYKGTIGIVLYFYVEFDTDRVPLEIRTTASQQQNVCAFQKQSSELGYVIALSVN